MSFDHRPLPTVSRGDVAPASGTGAVRTRMGDGRITSADIALTVSAALGRITIVDAP